MTVGIYDRKKRGRYECKHAGFCFCCGTKDSKDLKTGRQNWYMNHDSENNALCHRCGIRLTINPKWMSINNKKWNPIYNKRKQRFKDRFILLKANPRAGVCCWCFRMGKNVRIEMAHLKGYSDDDPLYGTYPLCVKCHRRFDRGALKPAKTRKELEILLAKSVRPQYYHVY